MLVNFNRIVDLLNQDKVIANEHAQEIRRKKEIAEAIGNKEKVQESAPESPGKTKINQIFAGEKQGDETKRVALEALHLLQNGEVTTLLGLVKFFQAEALKDINRKAEHRHQEALREKQLAFARAMRSRASTVIEDKDQA